MARNHYNPVDINALLESLKKGKNRSRQIELDRVHNLLTRFYHQHYHQRLQVLKKQYRQARSEANHGKRTHTIQKFSTQFSQLLQRANYEALSLDQLKASLGRKALIRLTTKVDFSQYSELVAFVRGRRRIKAHLKRLVFFTRELEFDIYDRVAMFMQFKEPPERKSHYPREAGRPNQRQQFLFLFRNVPCDDVDILLPNLKTRMTMRDLALIVLPALGAGTMLMLKIIPQFLLLGVAFVFMAGGQDLVTPGYPEAEIKGFVPLMIGIISLAIALGGFSWRQYVNYRRRVLEFQKRITDSLFFQSLDHGEGVLFHMLNEAEEEDRKEALLAYAMLREAGGKLSIPDLSRRVEDFLNKNFQVNINFDVRDPFLRWQEFAPEGNPAGFLELKDNVARLAGVRKAQTTLQNAWLELAEAPLPTD